MSSTKVNNASTQSTTRRKRKSGRQEVAWEVSLYEEVAGEFHRPVKVSWARVAVPGMNEALHVAGHALVACLLGTRAGILTETGLGVRAAPTAPISRDTHEVFDVERCEAITDELLCQVIMPSIMAGCAAEVIGSKGGQYLDCYNDTLSRERGDRDFELAARVGNWAYHLPDQEMGEAVSAILRVSAPELFLDERMEQAQDLALRLLEQHRDTLCALAETLLVKRYLTWVEVETLVREGTTPDAAEEMVVVEHVVVH